jgi:hypothetical protein
MLGILAIAAFISFGNNLLTKQNPTSVYSREINNDIRIDFNETLFLVAQLLPFGKRLNQEFSLKFEMTFRYVNTDGTDPYRQKANNL